MSTYYTIIGVSGLSFDSLKQARAFCAEHLRKDDIYATAIRGSLGMHKDIIARHNQSGIRYFSHR